MNSIANIKKLPHNYDIERSFISCLLMTPDLISESKLKQKDFYTAEHRKIYHSIQTLYKKWLSVDITMLASEWCETDVLFDIASEVASPSSFRSYESVIKQKSIYRSVIGITNKLHSLAYDEWEISEIFTQAKNIIDTPTGSEDKGDELLDVITDFVDNIWIVSSKICEYWYPKLDGLTNGIWPGQLIVIGAWPWTGKTMFAMNIADQIIRQQVNVGFFPLEMTKTEVAKRFIAKRWWIPSNLLDSMKDQKDKIIKDISEWMWTWELWSFKIFKKDNRFDAIHQRIRREAIQNDTKVFVVDHLGLIIEQTKGINKNDIIGYMTAEFKKTAEELWVAIILLSQLNRSGQWNNEPTLNSLRDSWNIEQDANVVMLLHKDPFPTAEAEVKLTLAKVRDWQVWEVKMKFDYPFMRVTEQND